MKPSVYVESSIPSLLTGRPSRLLLVRAHQQVTRQWWRTAPDLFRLFVSELVLEEIQEGHPEAARRRLESVAELPVLVSTEDIRALASEYQRLLRLPDKALVDLTHVGMAAVHEMDYLVTWNCAHIANPRFVREIARANHESGRFVPMIVTREELLGLEEGAIR